jgi:starch-binding outer membrane protein, SusD/RagB family
MKKYIYKIILGSSILWLLAGCSDNYLDITPQSSVVTATFYKTDLQLLEALNAAYSALGDRNLYGNSYILQRTLMEEGVSTSEAGSMQSTLDFSFDASNANVLAIWTSIYKGIYRCNLVLQNAPNATKIEYPELQERIIAEATVLRALYNWHLAVLWGSAPLRTINNMDEKAIAKSDTAAIWSLIESDLKSVIESEVLPVSYPGGVYESLSGGNEKGRITQGAAIALLGKVELYRNNYSGAAKYFSQIIGSSIYGYSLNSSLDDVWSIAGNNSSEMIMEVMFNASKGGANPYYDDGGTAAEGTNRNVYIGPSQYGGWMNVYPVKHLISDFESGDPRLSAYVWKHGDQVLSYTDLYDSTLNKSPYSIKKGLGSGFTSSWGGGFSENAPLIRYADVLLMYAECIANGATDTFGNGAAYYVNLVRQRAFGSGYKTVQALMSENGWDILTAIKHEREVELCFECHRYNDLVRWGDARSNSNYVTRGINNNTSTLYYPIPQNDIDNSNGVLTQNDGY